MAKQQVVPRQYIFTLNNREVFELDRALTNYCNEYDVSDALKEVQDAVTKSLEVQNVGA